MRVAKAKQPKSKRRRGRVGGTVSQRAKIELRRARDQAQEALEQQRATAEILRVISSSPTDAEPVFEAIVRSGIRLFEGAAVTVARPENGQVRLMAIAERDPERARKWRDRFPFPLTREYMHGVAVLDCRMVDMPDVEKMDERFAAGKRNFAESGYRAMTVVPMVKDGAAIGTIAVVRVAAGPLSDKQIALLKTFADQAVIAIENVRLFNETREALERQTATAEVLGVISSSPTNTQPVFEAIVDSCLRLFPGHQIGINLVDEAGGLYLSAARSPHADTLKRYFEQAATRRAGSSVKLRRAIAHYPDVESAADVPEEVRAGCRAAGIESIVYAPLVLEGRGIGSLWIGRAFAGPFADKEISLLKTFADQAVIAIQNMRLFNETREALDQQSALAEVLGAISSSIADTAPVFDKILDSCQRLFEGHLVGLTLAGEDGMVYLGAYKGEGKEKIERIYPMPLSRESGTGCAILDRRIVHFADVNAPGSVAPPQVLRGAQAIGFNSIIFAPLIAEARGIGALWVARLAPGPFSEKQTTLLQSFADQAVIAIQNARLFQEIQKKSRELEIANRHKSEFLANMSHELRTPLNAIIGFTRIVMRRSQEMLEPQQYENLEKILASGQHLLALINSILDLAKVEAGRVEVNPGEIALAPVLEHCARTVEPLLKADAVTLVKEFDGAISRMYVDEEKLRQIVINLLSNAAKFTSQGSIRLQARASNGSVAIAVADTGIGIAPDKLEVIFEEFAQADASSTRVYGGTGLGLTIARRLARLMGGDITAESALGSGSRFTLTLPLRYASPGA